MKLAKRSSRTPHRLFTGGLALISECFLLDLLGLYHKGLTIAAVYQFSSGKMENMTEAATTSGVFRLMWSKLFHQRPTRRVVVSGVIGDEYAEFRLDSELFNNRRDYFRSGLTRTGAI